MKNKKKSQKYNWEKIGVLASLFFSCLSILYTCDGLEEVRKQTKTQEEGLELLKNNFASLDLQDKSDFILTNDSKISKDNINWFIELDFYNQGKNTAQIDSLILNYYLADRVIFGNIANNYADSTYVYLLPFDFSNYKSYYKTNKNLFSYTDKEKIRNTKNTLNLYPKKIFPDVSKIKGSHNNTFKTFLGVSINDSIKFKQMDVFCRYQLYYKDLISSKNYLYTDFFLFFNKDDFSFNANFSNTKFFEYKYSPDLNDKKFMSLCWETLHNNINGTYQAKLGGNFNSSSKHIYRGTKLIE